MTEGSYQALVTQTIELMKSNQKIVDDVIHANTILRSEMSKIVTKMDDLITVLRNFVKLAETAGQEEMHTSEPESMKLVTEQLQKLVEQNQSIIEALDTMNRRTRAGTPVSQLLTSGIKLRREYEE